ncbi:hypothetical protein M758_9G084600 [Ceratodon purpureus]|nr:hypothetical protein M758_9G084600 [Ceratodon purpureus]
MVFRDRILKQQPDSAGSYYDGLSLRQIMVVLVHYVYFRDLEHRAERELAKALGYQDDDAEKAGREHWQPIAYKDIDPNVDAKKLKKLGLEILQPVAGDLHPNKNAPRLAIVLRGTLPLPQYLRDFGSDAKIALEILTRSKRVMECQKLILKVIKDFLSRGGSQNQICMAGHSLGAAIALLVGKELVYAHGIHIDTHLFNPPLLTFASIASGELSQISLSRRSLRTSKMKLDAEWEKFKKLLDWIPHFYLNPSDIICLQYIRYYEKQHEVLTEENVEKSKQARITRQPLKFFKKDVNIISNVVPSADVWISRKYKSNPVLAHSLKQWHQDPESADIRLEFQPRPIVGEW